MRGRSSQLAHDAAMTRQFQLSTEADAIREHLNEVVQSPAFRVSRRSLEFLQHIVEKALAGEFDDLKERSLGVQIFGRPATYDTGSDAIVRVTASDVRKRLHQFYTAEGVNSPLRIELPSGSYIPEFRKFSTPEINISGPQLSAPLELLSEAPAIQPRWGKWQKLLALAALLLCLAAAGGHWYRQRFSNTAPVSNPLPWSALFSSERDLRIIFCDPDISMAQHILNFNISLSDYANQKYLPATAQKNAEALRLVGTLKGVNVAAVDAEIATTIARLKQDNPRQIRTHTARSFHVLDFKTDDNFVIFGSPRSNPWFNLFQDRLDFRFDYDPATNQEIIRNFRVQKGESPAYVPTAKGWATGIAYAVVAFIENPNQKGHVLLLAGSNAEATEAAGKLATNPEKISHMLSTFGIDPEGPPKHFEALLRVSTLAGSSSTFQVVACHPIIE